MHKNCITDNRPIICVSIFFNSFLALIDSVASCSVLSEAHLPESVQRCPLPSPAKVSGFSRSRAVVTISHYALCSLKFHARTENQEECDTAITLSVTFLLTPPSVALKHGIDSILGSEFLYKYRTKICYDRLSVQVPQRLERCMTKAELKLVHIRSH